MNCKKISKTAVAQILDHCGRSDSGRSCIRANQNIDPTRSHLNYNLAAEIQPEPPLVFHKERIKEIYVHGNASVTLVNWIVTAPQTLPEEEHREFFKACFDKWKNDYGKENVVSAYVHLDETSPHMHFCFIPVVKTDTREKLCAKEVITRNHLQKAHGEMEEYVSEILGHHVDILNGATREGNKSLADFKRGKAKEDLEKAEKEAERIVAQAKEKAETIVKDYEIVSAAYENKKDVMDKIDSLSVDDEEFSGVEEHKPTSSEPKHYFKVPANIWYRLKISKDTVEFYRASQKKATHQLDKLVKYKEANRELLGENHSLKKELAEAKESVEEYKKWIKKFHNVFRKLEKIIPDFQKLYKRISKEIDAEEEKEERNIKPKSRNDFNYDIER